ncbi:MAG: hypothetical protein RH917_07590 [Lacipirellulaceae bacterium]
MMLLFTLLLGLLTRFVSWLSLRVESIAQNISNSFATTAEPRIERLANLVQGLCDQWTEPRVSSGSIRSGSIDSGPSQSILAGRCRSDGFQKKWLLAWDSPGPVTSLSSSLGIAIRQVRFGDSTEQCWRFR